MMKNWSFKHTTRILLFFPAVIASLILLDSCNDCPKDWQLEYFTINLEIYDDVSGENLLQIASYYDRDSVKVYGEEGEELFPGPVTKSGSIYFDPYFTKPIPLNSSITEYFFIHLIKDGLDVDTLKLEFSAEMNECEDKEFSYVNLYYNGQLVFEKQNWSRSIFVDLYK